MTRALAARRRRPDVEPLDDEAIRIMRVYGECGPAMACFCWPAGLRRSSCGHRGRGCPGVRVLLERAALTTAIPADVLVVLDQLEHLDDHLDDHQEDHQQ